MDLLQIIDSYAPTQTKKKIDSHGKGRLSEWIEAIEIRESPLCGEGLFARSDIKAGTVLFEQDEQKIHQIPLGQFWSFPTSVRSKLYPYLWQVDHFTLIGPKIDKEGNIVDKESIDAQYLINHSSDPNCWFEGDANIVARRDVAAGEELVIDYATIEANGTGEGFEAKGAREKRSAFDPFDFERHFAEYEGHTLSYVHKISKFTANHECHATEGSLYELHREIVSKPHPLGYGRGLFAKGPIPKGSILWLERNHNFDLSDFTPVEELREMKDEKRREWILHYGYQVDLHVMHSPKMGGDLEQDHSNLMNHSCDPTVLVYNRQIWLASRDIKEGDEIAFDYATSEVMFDRLPTCLCGAGTCRGKVTKDDWKLPALRQRYGDFWQPHVLGLLWSLENK